jgi:hypothetical protein
VSSSSSLTAVQATNSMECCCRALRLLLSCGKHVICLSLECLSLLEIPFFFLLRNASHSLISGDLVFFFLFGVLGAPCKLCFVSPICNKLLESF